MATVSKGVKPILPGWESAIEAKIRSAQERGEFDNLPGAGKPLPGRNEPYDEMWWIKSFLKREELPGDLLLPTPLQLRRRIEQLPAELRDLDNEQAVREIVTALNTEIVAWLRMPEGPRITVRPIDTDEAVRQWRAHRQRTAPPPAPPRPSGNRPRLPWRRRRNGT